MANTVYPLTGRCDCEQIRFQMERAPLFVHCCHCRWCQRESGSAFILNAMIETANITTFSGKTELIHTPSASGKGQKIARCPNCRIAVWSHYSGAGPKIAFVRVGTLDEPDHLPPDIHIFTSSKQPWVQLAEGSVSVPEYYARENYWSAENLQRREVCLAR